MLYHVTYIHALPSIQRHGLVPGAGQNFGMGYEAYSRGNVFLTDEDGISFWASRLEDQANANTDNPEEGWVPVVLLVPAVPVTSDREGTRDAGAEAWKTREKIPAEDILVWDGDEWEDLDDVEPEDMLDKALEAAEFVDEDGGYWEMDFEVFLPPEAR